MMIRRFLASFLVLTLMTPPDRTAAMVHRNPSSNPVPYSENILTQQSLIHRPVWQRLPSYPFVSRLKIFWTQETGSVPIGPSRPPEMTVEDLERIDILVGTYHDLHNRILAITGALSLASIFFPDTEIAKKLGLLETRIAEELDILKQLKTIRKITDADSLRAAAVQGEQAYTKIQKGIDDLKAFLEISPSVVPWIDQQGMKHFNQRIHKVERVLAKHPMVIHDTDLKEWLEDNFYNQGLDIQIREIGEPLLIATLDEALLDRIFLNLLTNAKEANAEKVLITIFADQSSNALWLTVSDDGDGMNRKGVERAMTILSREAPYNPEGKKPHDLPLFSTKKATDGIHGGMGMRILRRAVDGLKGIITVRSYPQKLTGDQKKARDFVTTFTLAFPVEFKKAHQPFIFNSLTARLLLTLTLLAAALLFFLDFKTGPAVISLSLADASIPPTFLSLTTFIRTPRKRVLRRSFRQAA
jgi:signal transduction histidine kinase